MRQTYPEDFNDYINSNEFIAIIDMIAYLGQSLAFRMDLNSQENFMDTANRRESILKLARLLSYKPKRNIPSRGLVKIMSVVCNDDIYDSNGTNLNGTTILWNDPNNPDWFEQFILVINNVFVQSNPFGQPIEKATLGSIKSQIYRLNNVKTNAGQFKFNASVDNQSLPFELVNIRIKDQLAYEERMPDINAAFHIIYQNDGNGNQSKNTGFFMYFKQGDLRFEDFNITVPSENRVFEYNATNVNEHDVWVQTIDEIGSILIDWTKVPAFASSNIIYNDIDKNIRNVFTVQTLNDNRISVRFGDGRFGNVPSGIIRCWHRVSANQALTIRPQDISNLNIPVLYLNKNGLEKRCAFTIALQETITNSQANETEQEIRRRAPQIYYSQNRMVSGEDYNVFPLDDTTIAKAKAINRIYSGHSRFIDINDPTGKHQNTNVFADDGILYKEYDSSYEEVTVSDALTPDEIISTVLQPLLNEKEFKNFIYETVRWSIKSKYPNEINITQELLWNPSSVSTTNSSGIFVNSNGSAEPVGPTVSGFKKYITQNALIKFEKTGWVGVQSVFGQGNYVGANGLGAITLTENVPVNDKVIGIMPKIRTTFGSTEIDNIKAAIISENTFALMYDFTKDKWFVRDTNFGNYNSDSDIYEISKEQDLTQTNSWLQLIEFKGSLDSPYWSITNRGLRFVFESIEDVRFFFVNGQKIINQETGLLEQDNIKIFKTNGKPEFNLAKNLAKEWYENIYISPTTFIKGDFVRYKGHYYTCLNTHITPSGTNSDAEAWIKDFNNWEIAEGYLTDDIVFDLNNTFTYEDGYQEPRKVLLSYTDHDQDGLLDNPEAFDEIIFGELNYTDTNPKLFVHFERYTSYDGYDYYKPNLNVKWFVSIDNAKLDYANNPNNWTDGDVIYVWDPDNNIPEAYWDFDIDRIKQNTDVFKIVEDPTKFIHYVGRTNINFQWKHIADNSNRIDPAITNIIDLYVLTQEYDFLLRQWIVNNESIDLLPLPPTVEQLRLTYSSFDDYKMISDQLIWHPVKYKLLFGDRADEEFKATIKITKLPNATMSDGEIKASVITSINKYFNIENWSFGDTFYFSELSAFIHQELATQIGGVTLVPMNQEARFGNLYDIKSNSDEIFISCATVSDIEIVSSFTEQTLRVNI